MLCEKSGEEVQKMNSTNIYFSKTPQDTESAKQKTRAKGERALYNRISIPVPDSYFDNIPLDESCLKINDKNKPSIGCYTLLNAKNQINCADLHKDGSICAIGFNSGVIECWVFDSELNVDLNGNFLTRRHD